MPIATLQHRLLTGFQNRLQPGILYISIEFASMSHLCCCGCGREVITPLSPKDWKFTYDGASVSVHPSIGNWSLPCRSHYIIQSGGIRWAGIGAMNKSLPVDNVICSQNEAWALRRLAPPRPNKCRLLRLSRRRVIVLVRTLEKAVRIGVISANRAEDFLEGPNLPRFSRHSECPVSGKASNCQTTTMGAQSGPKRNPSATFCWLLLVFQNFEFIFLVQYQIDRSRVRFRPGTNFSWQASAARFHTVIA